jgi:hypothetical protein
MCPAGVAAKMLQLTHNKKAGVAAGFLVLSIRQFLARKSCA